MGGGAKPPQFAPMTIIGVEYSSVLRHRVDQLTMDMLNLNSMIKYNCLT